MISEQAIQAVDRLRAPWPTQAISDSERDAWLRALTDPLAGVSLEDFGSALAGFVRRGGSAQASRPGFRPGVGELMGAVQAERAARLRASAQQTSREPWADFDPDSVSRHVAEIKAANGLDRLARRR